MSASPTFKIPVSNGLLSPEHYRRMRDALWLFLWYIDHTTQEKNDADNAGNILGAVHRAVPLCDEVIAGALGVSTNTARNWRKRLAREGYIKTQRTSVGYKVWVNKSKKWSGQGAVKNRKTGRSDSQNIVTHDELSDSQESGNQSPSDSQNLRPESQNLRPDSQKSATPYRQNKDFTRTEQKEKQSPSALSSQTSKSTVAGKEIEDLILEIKVVALEQSSTQAQFGRKDEGDIRKILRKASFDRKHVLDLVKQQVIEMDDFALKKCGEHIAQTLEARLIVRTNRATKLAAEDASARLSVEQGKAEFEREEAQRIAERKEREASIARFEADPFGLNVDEANA